MRIFINYKILLILKAAILLTIYCIEYHNEKDSENVPVSYFIDSRNGNDLNSGHYLLLLIFLNEKMPHGNNSDLGVFEYRYE